MDIILGRLVVFLTILYVGFVHGIINEADFKRPDILDYDVCVIGGGSAGTYAAIRLRDSKKTVAVVETKDRLGGHTETWQDPASGAKVDIGVIVFHNKQFVKDYFGRFAIPLSVIDFSSPGVTTQYVDFSTGKVVPGYTPPDPSAALAAYGAQLAKYPYLAKSLDSVPNPVPADLLLTFGAFVKKYKLEDGVSLFASYGQGFGDILNLPTLYIVKYFSPDLLADFQLGSLSTTRNDNSELYEKAQAELGKDALLSSSVIGIDRSNPSRVKLLVKTPTGKKLIRAKKIISTIPPVLNNLHGFDLDKDELSIFKRFRAHGYYVGVLNNSGIPDNLNLNNIGAKTPYNLPVLPAAYGISPTRAPGQHLFQFGTKTNQVLSNDEVKAEIVASLNRLRAAGTLPKSSGATPGYSIFSNHSPYEVYVSAAQISKAFYSKLFALQGKKNTFWTGAAFVTHDSTMIWEYTETLIAKIVASL